MKSVVVQCAGRKNAAGTMSLNNQKYDFVACPEPDNPKQVRPWDDAPEKSGKTWVEMIRRYNTKQEVTISDSIRTTSEGLLSAYALYKAPIYAEAFSKFGTSLCILSAGWGLVRATDLIPTYNITFSSSGDPGSRISVSERLMHDSLRNAKDLTTNEIHLFLTPHYLKYWRGLNEGALDHAQVSLHCRAGQRPPKDADGMKLVYHDCGKQKTNWHYTALSQFIAY